MGECISVHLPPIELKLTHKQQDFFLKQISEVFLYNVSKNEDSLSFPEGY